MHKIWQWFRGDNDPKFWHGAAPSSDKRRWRSERTMARTSEGARQEGSGNILRNFDAVQAASVSSPTVMLPSKSVKTVQDRLVLINSGNSKRTATNSMRSVPVPAEDRATTSAAAVAESTKGKASSRHQNTKPPLPSTANSANPKESRRHNKSCGISSTATSAVTTDDLPDKKMCTTSTANGAAFRVEKKSVSANEMRHSKKMHGTLLQRLRQRFRKNGDRRSAMASATAKDNDNFLPSAESHTTTVTMTVAVETCQNGGSNEQRQHVAVAMAQQRRDDYRLHGGESARSGDALGDEDASQGRCSSFDYFSATASPIDQRPLTERTDVEHQPPPHMDNNDNEEEELRFATAAEARAYLRRQHEGRAAEEEEEEDEELEGCDADDEITTATTSAMCDSLLLQRRPHSAMATTPGQRESVYFTATVMVQQSATTPDIARKKPPLHQQQQQKQLRGFRGMTRQKSSSQIALADNSAGVGITGGSGHGSVPGSTTFSRRCPRFVIPQVSICDTEGISAGEKAANKNNNNDGDLFDDGGDEKLLPDRMNTEDIANNNSKPHESTVVNFAGLEAEDDSMLSEQDKQLRKALSDMDRKQLTLAQRRQSNMDVVYQASGRRTSTTLIPLTSAQIHLIRSLWRQVYLSKGPTVIGSQISHRMFFKEPEMRELFRRCALPQQFANHDSFSKAHCKQISELIDQVVESLDDLEHVGPMLEQVGRCHAHISGGQLSSKMWNLAAETFIDCTLEWGDRRARSETVRKAWALIIAFMVERIKHGHLEERRHISAIRSTIASLERVAMASTTTVQQSYYEVQQPTTSSSMQLPVPVSSVCHPIRRVSAFATGGANQLMTPNGAGGVPADRTFAGGGPVPLQIGNLPTAVGGAMPKYVASSEACPIATVSNASPYTNRRRHEQPPKAFEKGEKKHHHRRSSSSSGQQSPKIGSVGTVRRTEGAALAQRTTRPDSARRPTTNSAIPMSLGSMRKKMSESALASTRKQNAKASTAAGSNKWTDI